MDNNNKNTNPLEELKKINQRMAQRPAPAVNSEAAAPKTPAAQNTPKQTPPASVQQGERPAPAVRSQRPAPAVAQNQNPAPTANNRSNNDELLEIVNRSAANDGAQRAEKVRMARANSQANNQSPAVNNRAALDRTRITGTVNSAAAQNAQVKSSIPQTPTSGTAPARKTNINKKKNPKQKDGFEETIGRGIMTNSVKAIIYIVAVLIVSGCLSLFAIFVGNDVFAFVKDTSEVTVTIPAGATLSDIAEILGDNDIVNYPSMFKLYINLRNKDTDEYLSGDITVSASMPYDSLIAAFKPNSSQRTELTITIVEGMDVDEIIALFLENGIGTEEGFVDVIQNYDFDFWFVDELDTWLAENPDSGRKYRLEGYLFPDTYNFYSSASEADVIYKLLVNFDSKFDEDKRTRAADLGYTCDEIITLASIIQKEAKFISDYDKVSSVFHNRLSTNVTGRKLESNATVQYTMPDDEVRLELTYAEIEKYDNAYNTYLYAGLPVGAISNPSLNAINMALYPADTDYYFFVSDASGANLYATTSAEHERNCAQVAAEAAAGDGEQ